MSTPTPYWTDGQVTLYCGDFRELLPGVLAVHGEPDLTGATFALPDGTWRGDGPSAAPHWGALNHDVSAWPEGVDIDQGLEEDVDGLEAYALSLLAAVRAHRQMRAES